MAHVSFGVEVVSLNSLLPAAVYALLRKHFQCYLYGNLMADMILGKRYVPRDRNSHSWSVALELLESSETESEKAFSLGYMSHLAADTVVHSDSTLKHWNLNHAFWELKADNSVASAYWRKAVSIDSTVQHRHDAFLERFLDTAAFSFNTNKLIYKGAIVLSLLNHSALSGIFNVFSGTVRNMHLEKFHRMSIERIVDVLSNSTRSHVLKVSPAVV